MLTLRPWRAGTAASTRVGPLAARRFAAPLALGVVILIEARSSSADCLSGVRRVRQCFVSFGWHRRRSLTALVARRGQAFFSLRFLFGGA